MILVPWWTSWRVRFSGLCFVGFFFLYAQRVNLSIAIVCMIKTELSSPESKRHSNAINVSITGTLPNNVTTGYSQGFLNQTSAPGDLHNEAKKCPEQSHSQNLVYFYFREL
jgi:hypothetical protein